MLPKPEDCIGCTLHDKDSMGFIATEGAGTFGVLAFGEAGGSSERSDGLPFRPFAEAGSVLERTFRRLGYDRQQFALGNIVNCQPPRNYLDGAPWEYEAINACRIHRDRMVQRYQPRCLLALGGIALRTLTGLAGRKQGVLDLRGYVLPAADYFLPCCPHGRVRIFTDPPVACRHCGSPDGKGQPIPVVAATHPAYIKRAKGLAGGKGGSTAESGPFFNDIEKAVTVARNGWNFDEYIPQYNSAQDSSEIIRLYESLREDPELVLAWDLETNTSADNAEDELLAGGVNVLQSIQFSIGKGTGYFVPWRDPYIDWARKIMALPNQKLSWNGWLFDAPLVEAMGWEIGGVHDDLMWAYQSLQPDLPLGLQYAASLFNFPFPWKHWSTQDPERYGCVDVDVLHWINDQIWDFLKKLDVLRSYTDHKRRINPILRKATGRGIPVNEERREELRLELEARKAELVEKMQVLVPSSVQSVHPKEGYKVLPKELTKALQLFEYRAVNPDKENDEGVLSREEMVKWVRKTVPKAKREDPTIWDYREFKIKSDPNGPLDLFEETVWRWCKILPFKPGSWQQVLRYIKFQVAEDTTPVRRRAKWYVPKTYKEDRETTEARELERLQKSTKDPLLAGVLEFREVDKMLGTYVVGWQPGSDGKIHPTYKFNTGTGQLVAVQPNAMTPPKHRSIAKTWARMIAAPPECMLVSFDFKSFHALTTGFEARDLTYMRMARLDIHSFLTSHFVKDPVDPSLPDDEVREKLAWIKKNHRHIRDYKAKRVVLGKGFGLRPNACFNMYREDFKSLAEVKKLFAVMEDLFSVHKVWMEEITRKAHNPPCYLRSLHGSLRWFFRVFDWNGAKNKLVPGPDHEAAIAYLPANDAHGHFKDCMIRLEDKGLMETAGFILPVHDDLRFVIPKTKAPELISQIYQEMVKPSTILVDEIAAPEGLSVDVEVSAGDSWAEMKDWDVGAGTFQEEVNG